MIINQTHVKTYAEMTPAQIIENHQKVTQKGYTQAEALTHNSIKYTHSIEITRQVVLTEVCDFLRTGDASELLHAILDEVESDPAEPQHYSLQYWYDMMEDIEAGVYDED